MNFFRNFKMKHLTIDGANYVLAAGQTTVNSEGVDTANYRELCFVVTLGAMVAASTVDFKLQGSADNATGWTDIAGSALVQVLAATGANKMHGICISIPSSFRYFRMVTTRGGGANSTVEDLKAILCGPRSKAKAQDITSAGQWIADPEFWLSPAAGTA